ncbi:Apolipophorin [Orchesella cincta]|uniref:Apolipophorin n=1 Tax=Orchesella cincta TaxID=48709 RepID=A0A1D2N793_ORCCI|nr:Apolipophorin [Orchesella cincta]
MSDPEGYALFWGQLTGHYPHFVVNGESNVTGIIPSPSANFSVDFGKPYFTMCAVHDLTNGVFAEGGVVDSRNAIFDITESYDNFRFSDVNFYLRLNHSRLITSKLKWRPELFSEIKASPFQSQLIRFNKQHFHFDNNYKTEGGPEDLNFTMDIEALQTYLIEMYNDNELYLQDIHDFVQLFAEEVVARIKASIERYRRELASPAKLLEKAVEWIVAKFHEIYEHLSTTWSNYMSNSGEGFSSTLEKLRQLFFLYLNDGLQLVEELFFQVYQSLSTFASKIYAQLGGIVERYRPIVMAHLHELEASVYNVVMRVLDFFYETKEAVMQSPYYQKLQKLAEDLDELYRDIRENDFETIFNKYFGMLKNFISRKLSELSQLKLPLGKLGERLELMLNGMVETEVIQDFKEGFKTAVEQVKWLIRYTEIDVLIPKVVLTLISKGKSIFFMTAIDTASNFQQAKTKFIFDSGKGIISLEQKLPMSLAAFNETPSFRELPEYQVVLKAQELFQSSEGSLWNVYHSANSKGNLLNLIPPFDGHAMLVGSHYFFTFDGLIYNHEGRCVHLLAADLVEGNFSVSLQYESKSEPSDGGIKTPSPYYIVVASGHNTLIIDLKENGLKDPKRNLKATLSLPIQMANLRGYRDSDMLVVESPKGLRVSCNTLYQICQLKVSGWYSRKVAGVLGTMDMEPVTDIRLANAKYTANLSEFFNSWDVSDDTAESCSDSSSSGMLGRKVGIMSPLHASCQRAFQSTFSSMQPCFSVIDVEPYIEMCLTAGEETQKGSVPSMCSSAVAYASQCRGRGVWVKIPSSCIKCDMNGEAMMDRDMKVISSPPLGSPSSRSTDVVFIVEAKDCNRALRTRRKIDTVVTALEEEFVKKRFKDNRYAAVVYGGDGVFEQPRPVVQNGEIFTTSENVGGYLTSIVMGKGNNDTFQALWYALHKLKFRPGVSKTFILLPCSSCNPKEMSVDYSTIHYAMLEQDAKLHILMNNEFTFDSKNLAKKFFGFDSTLGFTKSDGMKGRLRGDSSIQQQIFLPRRTLGYCAPLALETNGTIFSGKKLQNRREKIVTLFTTVFSRRVVQTASPADCQTCYCLQDEDVGAGKIECFVCGYPRYKPLPDGYDDNTIDTDSDGKQSGAREEEEDAYEDMMVVVDGEDEDE